MTSNVDELIAEVERLNIALQDAKGRLHAAKLAECGVSTGDVVTCTGRRKGDKMLVTDIDPYHPRPWLRGHPKKANGDWSKTSINIFDDWERSA